MWLCVPECFQVIYTTLEVYPGALGNMDRTDKDYIEFDLQVGLNENVP